MLTSDRSTGPAVVSGDTLHEARNIDPTCALPISSSLADVRRSLLEQGQQLMSLVEGPAQMLVEDAISVLQSQVCRIAVIGQVKAGKSSFINALIRRPGLLPAHVNPWTTAVTNLHFGHHNIPQGVAARFSFFDNDEWQKLATGDGHLRELTQRLVPGFEPELLVRNLKSMRTRAENRHGSQLAELLGQTHTFENFHPSLLESYVCAGDAEPMSVRAPAAGHYSDIVKSAEIYFEDGPFEFPTTVVDTPGTNDPFLIRDEVSRRSLDSADVYIVVLTATQPLAVADVALLRILRGLHKDRIVVFINRVDQLPNLPDDFTAVKTLVRNGLRREFPGVDIPILAGSAIWANKALQLGAWDAAPDLADRLAAFAQSREAIVPRDTAARLQGKDLAPEEMAQALFACSGLPQLTDTLDQIVNHSHAAHVVNHVAASFAELAHFGEATSRHEQRRIEADLAEMDNSTGEMKGEMTRLQEEVRRVQSLTHTMEKAFLDLEDELLAILHKEIEQLESRLRDVVREFSEKECVRLAEASHNGDSIRAWKTDATELRRSLEQYFTVRFGEIESEILNAEANIFPSLEQVVKNVLPDSTPVRGLVLRAAPTTPPSLSALSRLVTFDLGHPWWKAWWSQAMTTHERSQQLDRSIRTEFFPIADELVRSAKRQLTEQVTKSLQEAEQICLSIISALQKQCEWNTARAQEVVLTSSKKREQFSTAAHRARLSEIRRQLGIWEEINGRIGVLKQQCEQLVA